MNILMALGIALVFSCITTWHVQAVVIPEGNSLAVFCGDPQLGTQKVDLDILDQRLQPGDVIESVNGYPLISMQDMSYFALAKDGMANLKIRRDGKTALVPGVNLNNLYVDIAPATNGGVHRLVSAVKMTASNVVMSFASIKMLVTGEIPVTAVSGPVGAVAVMGSTVEQGGDAGVLGGLMLFAAVSASLGVMNLLPIPALDGGHLLFLGIEWVIRRPIPEKIKLATQAAMLMLLITITLLVLGMDVYGIVTGKLIGQTVTGG